MGAMAGLRVRRAPAGVAAAPPGVTAPAGHAPAGHGLPAQHAGVRSCPRVPTAVQFATASAHQRAHDPLGGARRTGATAPAASPPTTVPGGSTAPAVQLCGGCCGGCARDGDASPSGVLARLGTGTPMPDSAVAPFSRWLGAALPPLTLHTDSAVAAGLGARALTVGRHVAFAPGEFGPGSPRGDELISHELAHVVQQSGGSSEVQACGGGTQDAHEAEADAAARAVTTGGAVRLSPVRGATAGLVQRTPDPRMLTTTLTPESAALLSREEVVEQFRLAHRYLDAHPATEAHVPVAQANLLVLQTEMSRRSAAAEVVPGAGVGVLPRPPGLPEDEGYALVEIPDVPTELVGALPEGELLDSLTLPDAQDVPSTGGFVLPGLEIAGGTSVGTLTTSARALGTYGFAAAGPNAIGLVAFPQVGSPGHGFPQSRLLWGHTALYARIDGRIVILRSHAPASILGAGSTDWLRGGAVKTGTLGVPGAYYGQGYLPGRGIPMFTHTGAHSIEFPVSRAAALGAAEAMPEIGRSPLKYTGVPATANLCQGMNCLRWAVPEAERALGGRFGPVSSAGLPTSVSDIGPGGAGGTSPNQASQGRMYSWLQRTQGEPILGWDNRTGTRVVATVGPRGQVSVSALPPEATGAPTVGRMSTAMKYLRWGGRVFLVVGIGAGIAEIWAAPEGRRTRVIAEVASGLGGGVLGSMGGGAAAGAAAGLVCGPGAPVCSTVLAVGGAIIGGFVGGFGLRSIVSSLFDYDRAAYQANVAGFMGQLKSRTQGSVVVDPDGTMRWIPPDPRYSAYAGAIERFESGTSGGCQTCHDINYAWGETARRWGSPMPEGPVFPMSSAWAQEWQTAPPRRDALDATDLEVLRRWIETSPPASTP